MKKLLTILFLLLFLASARSQDYRWAYGFGGDDGNSHGNSIATDANANVYATGYFGDTLDFDPATGIFLLNSDYQKMFVTKYDSAGIYQWALTTEGAGISSGNSIAVNATGVYVTGEFYGTLDFDPGVAVSNLQSNNQSDDVFIARYDLNGNFIWAKKMGGPQNDAGNSIAIDDTGNVYVTGFFHDTVDFDPGTGIYNLISDTVIDGFIAKYDNLGNLIWVHDLCDANGAFGAGEKIAIDLFQNTLYFTGVFNGTVDFNRNGGVYNISSQVSYDSYVLKVDSSGNFIWAGSITSNSWFGTVFDISLSSNQSGEFFLTGAFNGLTDFDLDTGVHILSSTTPSPDLFVTKNDSNGNLVWVKTVGNVNTGGVGGLSLKTNSTDAFYLCGYYYGTTDFDPGNGIANLNSNGSSDIFFAKYDSIGNYIWAKGMGGLYLDSPTSLALDISGSQYITGYFRNSVDFDPGSGAAILFPSTSDNIFIGKYSDLTNLIINHQNAPAISIYPNPVKDFVHVAGDFKYSELNYKVLDLTGRILIEEKNTCNRVINFSAFPPGPYFIEIISFNEIYRAKIIKQ